VTTALGIARIIKHELDQLHELHEFFLEDNSFVDQGSLAEVGNDTEF